MPYKDNRAFADKFIPAMKQIVGPLLLTEASFEVDTQQAADLVVLKAANKDIGCRVRRPGYALDKDGDPSQYFWHITFRYALPNGIKTEWEKVRRGWGCWQLYAHATDLISDRMSPWFVTDLDALRYHLICSPFLKHGVETNIDGSQLKWFDIRYFPPDPPVVIASSLPVPCLVKK